MRFIELVLSNFKRFVDFQLEFCPGLNLIWGPNESGKSTIHEAIQCALFGRERGKIIENWNGGKCSVSLTYSDGKQVYRIERGITEGMNRLGLLKGGELTDVITDKNIIDQVVAEHIGISSQQVFNNTVSIRQLDLSRLDTADLESVGAEIQRVLTGTAHISAAEVIRRLEERQSDIKGRPRPSNPREYDRITDRLTNLAKELATARESRKRIEDLEEEIDRLQAQIEQYSGRLSVLEELLERHRRWTELKKSEAEKDSLHKSVYSTVHQIRETLSQLQSVQKSLEAYTDLVGRDEDILAQLNRIESRRAELETRLLELESAGERSIPATGRLVQAGLLTAALTLLLAGLLLGSTVDLRWFMLMIPGAISGFGYFYARMASRAVGFEHLSDMIVSAKSELKQLEADEANILNYINCKTRVEAVEKIKAYRSLTSQGHELEIRLRTLLNNRKPEDWEEQERELARQLSTIQHQLEEEFAGYSPTTQETESWRSEHASLKANLPTLEARLHEIRGALEVEKKNARDLASIEGEIEYLHSRKAELEFLYKAYDEALSALQTVVQMVSDEFLPTLSENASKYLAQITDNRYDSVTIGQNWTVSVNCRDRNGIQPTMLSVGTLDQLYFALRIACGGILSNNKKLPVILDDSFATFDQCRLDNALEMLVTLAKENQVIFFTHDPYIREKISAVPTASVCELPSP